LLESAPMRLRSALAKLFAVTAVSVSALVVTAASASAQVIVSPNAEATRNDGGWIYWIAIALGVLGTLLALKIVFGYMRFAPRFQREGTARTVKAARIQPGKDAPRRPVNITGAPVVVPAPVPVAAPAAAPVAAPPVAAPPAAAAVAAPTPVAAVAQPEAPVAEQSPSRTDPAPAASGERREVAIDQETFDRVLAELLEKGTARRVAEGQARRAAMIAARKKAGG
jgi:hypothetical protein